MGMVQYLPQDATLKLVLIKPSYLSIWNLSLEPGLVRANEVEISSQGSYLLAVTQMRPCHYRNTYLYKL